MSRFRFAIPLLIFIAALALYIRTTAPTLGGGWDSEEFQHAAYTLGIAHSTGYPLYLLIGKLFTTLVPLGNIAYRMNLLSAMLTACAVVLVYWNARLLTKHDIASIATAALFATNPAVWRQAGVASVGPLNLLLLNGIILALLLWREKKISLGMASMLFGLSLAHHRTTLLLAPAILLFVLQTDAGILRRPRELARNFFWLVLPLAFYLYLPIFGNNSPWYSNTLVNFLSYVGGSEAGNYLRDASDITATLTQILGYLFDSVGVIGVAIIGIWIMLRRKPSRIDVFLAFGFAIYLAFATLVTGEQDRYFVLPFVFLVYFFAVGISTAETFLTQQKFTSSFTRSVHPSSLQLALVIILTLQLVLPFPDRFRLADWSSFDRVYKQWDEIFTLPIPPNATLVGNWSQLNAMRYLQRIENRRTDLQLVGTQYDTAPQTTAARATLSDGRAIFLTPGIAQPEGAYRFAQLGPLLEVRDQPQTQSPSPPKNISITSALTLANFEITMALEPFAPMTSIAPNRTARVTLDWRAEAIINDFLVRVKLYDPENRVIAQKDEPPVRDLYPATQWSPGEYVRDVHNLQIPAGTPPGQYAIKIEVIDAATKQPIGNEISLAAFAVERATNLTRDQIFIAQPFDRAVNDRIALWGCGGCNGTHRAGETLGLSLVWYASAKIDTNLEMQITLADTTGRIAQSWQRAPIAFYPTSQWQSGEILKAYSDLPLSRDLPTNIYILSIGIASQTAQPIGKIQITP